MLTFLVGMAALAAVLWWLHRLKQQDLADCAAILGLAPDDRVETAAGRTAEGFNYSQRRVLTGSIDGNEAGLSVRNLRSPVSPKLSRKINQFSVLTIRHRSPWAVPFRLQPAGFLGTIERLHRETVDAATTGDAAFDEAYQLYASDPAAALRVLTPDVRREVLAFREASAGKVPAATATAVGSALLLGTFEIGPESSSYYVYGSPTRKVAEHLALAAPLVARLSAANDGR